MAKSDDIFSFLRADSWAERDADLIDDVKFHMLDIMELREIPPKELP